MEWIKKKVRLKKNPGNLHVEVAIDAGKIWVKFPFNVELVNRVNRNGLNFRYSRGPRIWYERLTIQSAEGFVRFFPEFKEALSYVVDPAKPPPKYVPSSHLMEHQRRAAVTALKRRRFGYFHDTGTGKTVTAIEIIRQKRLRTLVICPLSIIETAWLKDLREFAPEIKAYDLWDLIHRARSRIGKNQLKGALNDFDVMIINFESFRARFEAVSKLPVEIAIIDESSMIKDPRSKVTKKIIAWTDNIPYVYLLSGTPAPNTPMEYWPQARVIDATVFPRSFHTFRARYFYSTGYGNFTWVLKPEKEQEFKEKLSLISEVVRKEDVLDLPEKVTLIRNVTLSRNEQRAYQEMEENMYIEIEDGQIDAANAAVKVMKLREGTSGFFYDDDHRVVWYGHSKYEELMRLLDEIGDHQVIIWTHFRPEAQETVKRLKANGKTVTRVDGTVSSKEEKVARIQDFISGKYQYMVAHPRSLGHGQTLVNATYAVYLSMSHSYELQTQSMDRIYRKGQKNKCTYIFLVVKETVDSAIMRSLRTKGKFADNVLNYIRAKHYGACVRRTGRRKQAAVKKKKQGGNRHDGN